MRPRRRAESTSLWRGPLLLVASPFWVSAGAVVVVVVEAAAAIPGAVTPHSQEESSAGNQRQSTVPKAPDELLRPAAKPTSPAEPLKTVAQDVRARITHPTLTSDGNLTRPGVTAGATPNESGGPTTDSAVAPAEVGPVTTDSSAGEPTSNDETGSDGAAAA